MFGTLSSFAATVGLVGRQANLTGEFRQTNESDVVDGPAIGVLLEARMTSDILRLDVKLLEILQTELCGAVSPLVIGHLVLSKPDQVDLVPLLRWMLAMRSSHHVSQVDQSASASVNIFINNHAARLQLDLPAKESCEREFPRKSVLSSNDPLFSTGETAFS